LDGVVRQRHKNDFVFAVFDLAKLGFMAAIAYDQSRCALGDCT
jgi:hypothetical protein